MTQSNQRRLAGEAAPAGGEGLFCLILIFDDAPEYFPMAARRAMTVGAPNLR